MSKQGKFTTVIAATKPHAINIYQRVGTGKYYTDVTTVAALLGTKPSRILSLCTALGNTYKFQNNVIFCNSTFIDLVIATTQHIRDDATRQKANAVLRELRDIHDLAFNTLEDYLADLIED